MLTDAAIIPKERMKRSKAHNVYSRPRAFEEDDSSRRTFDSSGARLHDFALRYGRDIGGIVTDLKRDRLAISPNDPKIAILQPARDDRSVAPEPFIVLRIFALEPAEHGGEIFRSGLLHIRIVTSPARDRRWAIRR